jgi:hypothetical protein
MKSRQRFALIGAYLRSCGKAFLLTATVHALSMFGVMLGALDSMVLCAVIALLVTSSLVVSLAVGRLHFAVTYLVTAIAMALFISVAYATNSQAAGVFAVIAATSGLLLEQTKGGTES